MLKMVLAFWFILGGLAQTLAQGVGQIVIMPAQAQTQGRDIQSIDDAMKLCNEHRNTHAGRRLGTFEPGWEVCGDVLKRWTESENARLAAQKAAEDEAARQRLNEFLKR